MKRFFIRFKSLAARIFRSAQAEPDRLTVELMIYSGRPNPTFVIADADSVRDILTTALKLPRDEASKEDGATLPLSRLGYQGFLVHSHSAGFPHPLSFIVFHSAVQLAGVPAVHRIDANASLQNKLLGHAKRQRIVDDSLIEMIKNSG